MIGGSRTTAAVLAALLIASPAIADPKPPTDKEKQAAGELVRKAIARSQAGDHAGAIDLYQQAYAIVPSSVLLSNIGSELQQSGKLQDALHYFCMYLESDPGGTNAPYATSQAKALQIQLGQKPVDDRSVCAATPEVVPVPPPAPNPYDAKLAAAPVDHDAAAHHTTLQYAGAGIAVAGLAALGFGIYAGVHAKTLSDEVSGHNNALPWPANIRSIEHSGQRYEDLQIGFLISGGALTATGAILFVVGRPDRAESASDRTALRITPTRNGVAVAGRF